MILEIINTYGTPALVIITLASVVVQTRIAKVLWEIKTNDLAHIYERIGKLEGVNEGKAGK